MDIVSATWERARSRICETLVEATEPTLAWPRVLETLGGLLGASLCELWMPHHDRRSLRCEASWIGPGFPGEGRPEFCDQRFVPGQGFPGGVWVTRRPIVCDEVSEHPDFVRGAWARGLGLASCLAFPLLLPGNEVDGVLMAFARNDGTALTPPPLELLHDLGRLIGSFLARTRAEERARIDGRLEALGRLSAALADQMNNELCVILSGVGQLVAEGDRPGHELRELEHVRDAATRAARVTQKLLARAFEPCRQRSVIDLCGLVRNLDPRLRSALGTGIRLEAELDPEPRLVIGDPARLEQVVLDLVLHARRSMGDAGRVEIRCEGGPRGGVGPDTEVRLSVTDSGSGLDDASRSRIFDPLPLPGSRAGIGGLGVVYAEVKSLGGEVEVRSRCGEGTTFELRIPVAPRDAVREASAPRAKSRTGGSGFEGAVLLVEDDPNLRRQLRRILDASGFLTLEAGNADSALRLSRNLPEKLRLLLSDVCLPDSSGAELALQLRQVDPRLPVLLISGLSEEYLGDALDLGVHDAFLQKPFDRERLLEVVRRVLVPEPGTSPRANP